MRDITSFWRRDYNAVNTTDLSSQDSEACPGNGWRRNSSMKATTGRKLSLDQGIPIIDSFFYQRRSGEQTRQPKRNENVSFDLVTIHK